MRSYLCPVGNRITQIGRVALVLLLLHLNFVILANDNPFNIVPEPSETIVRNNAFVIDKKLNFVIVPNDSAFRKITAAFMLDLSNKTKTRYKMFHHYTGRGRSVIITQSSTLPQEGYSLDINAGKIEIVAADAAGLFYAMQTLRQLLINENNSWKFPGATINDHPKYSYRGVNMGNSNIGATELKKYIDIVSSYKINVFNLHPTDSTRQIKLSSQEINELINYAKEKYINLIIDTGISENRQPSTILPIDKEYALDPAPAYIWFENDLFPRIWVIAELLWTQTAIKDYRRFIDKIEHQFKKFDEQGIKYSKAIYDVSLTLEPVAANKSVKLLLSSPVTEKYLIRYNIKGNDPTQFDPIYTGPVELKQTAHIKTALFEQNKIVGKITENKIIIHKAIGGSIRLVDPLTAPAISKDLNKLIDGVYTGSLLFSNTLTEIIIDLQQLQQITQVKLINKDKLIPSYQIQVSISANGKKFAPLKKSTNTRYIKLGIPAGIFLEEIIVE